MKNHNLLDIRKKGHKRRYSNKDTNSLATYEQQEIFFTRNVNSTENIQFIQLHYSSILDNTLLKKYTNNIIKHLEYLNNTRYSKISIDYLWSASGPFLSFITDVLKFIICRLNLTNLQIILLYQLDQLVHLV